MKIWKPFLFSLCMGISLLGCSVNNTSKNKDRQELQSINWLKEPFAEYTEDPIALYDKGFLVNDGNREGFIDTKGNLLLDMKYKFQACFLYDAYGVIEGSDGEIQYLSQLLQIEGYDQGCWTGIIGPMTRYYYNDKHKSVHAVSYDMDASKYVDTITDMEAVCADLHADTFFLPVNLLIQSEEGKEAIRTKEGFVLVTNGKLHPDTVYSDVHMKNRVYRPHDILEALNAVKTDGKWAIMDKTGKLITGFDYEAADVLNDEFVKVKKTPYIGLYTKDRKEYLYDEIESITAPSQNTVFVKQDGRWGLMKFPE